MSKRTLLSIVVLGVLGWLLTGQIRQLLADPTIWPPDDYVQYWAAGWLNRHGENPYSAEHLLPLERTAGRRTTSTGAAGELEAAIMMWNPPWTLTVAMPLSLLSARVGQLVWLLLNGVAIAYSVARLWKLVGGQPERLWMAWLIAGTFLPTLFALKVGQITPLVLLGATLFAWAAHTGRFFWAGMAGVLLAIKPHLVYLIWPLIAVEAVYRFDWRIVVGGVVGGVLTSLIPLAMNPDVFQQYVAEMSERPPAQWVSLTIGSLLRLVLGESLFGLQFVSVPLGLIWASVHWWRRRNHWKWQNELPAIVLVSFVTAPYGAWHFDLVLMLVPLVMLAASLYRLAEHQHTDRVRLAFWIVYVLMNGGMLTLNILGVSSILFAWVAPVTLMLFVTIPRVVDRE